MPVSALQLEQLNCNFYLKLCIYKKFTEDKNAGMLHVAKRVYLI